MVMPLANYTTPVMILVGKYRGRRGMMSGDWEAKVTQAFNIGLADPGKLFVTVEVEGLSPLKLYRLANLGRGLL